MRRIFLRQSRRVGITASVFLRHFRLLVLLLALTLAPAWADWEVVKDGGTEYVTLRSFCDFYHMKAQEVSRDRLACRSAQASVDLQMNSRECLINGRRYWLSLGTAEGSGGQWLVSKTDVIKLFDPVLRPGSIEGKKAVQGVVIDAGHGGADNGAISRVRGKNEKTYTLDTARRLEALLKAAGIRTVLTRRSDVFVDLYERARRTSIYPDYIFVSLHYNSGESHAHGLETYACSPRGTPSTSSGGRLRRSDYQRVPGNANDQANILLASLVHSQILQLRPGDAEADRGVKRARFVVLKECVIPGILVEGGFLSNRKEADDVETQAYRQRLAESIARGIQAYIGVMNRTGTLPPRPQLRPVETPSAVPASAPKAPAASAAEEEPEHQAPAAPEPETRLYPTTPSAPAAPTAPAATGTTNQKSWSKPENDMILIYEDGTPVQPAK